MKLTGRWKFLAKPSIKGMTRHTRVIAWESYWCTETELVHRKFCHSFRLLHDNKEWVRRSQDGWHCSRSERMLLQAQLQWQPRMLTSINITVHQSTQYITWTNQVIIPIKVSSWHRYPCHQEGEYKHGYYPTKHCLLLAFLTTIQSSK